MDPSDLAPTPFKKLYSLCLLCLTNSAMFSYIFSLSLIPNLHLSYLAFPWLLSPLLSFIATHGAGEGEEELGLTEATGVSH